MSKVFNLKSKYFSSVGDKPLQEYPRPQLVRDSYLNLNGLWDYAILKKGNIPKKYDGKILVPFSPEALLSSVNKTVLPDDVLFYKTTFFVPDGFLKDKTIIHFTAVDYACAVFVNGKTVGTHRGGYHPFDFDISSMIVAGENEIRVEVTDPTDTGVGSKGKQKLNAGNIWYTSQSGIWGTVWIESVTSDYVSNLKLIPDIDDGVLKVSVSTSANRVKIVALDNGAPIASRTLSKAKHQTTAGEFSVDLKLDDYILWTPESPKLYDLEITAGKDQITSYFGMRKFSVGADKSGIQRLMLNNAPYFHNGVLDQGYYSDGKLTPPSDEAMINDIRMLKEMGFNMIRKHIKVEPLRWYYHCDRIGMLVWQDMVNGGSNYNPLTTMVLPFLGINFRDSYYKLFARESIDGRNEFIEETKQTIDLLKNSVSLAMWVPFNEGWGQFDSDSVSEMIKDLDPTRTIDRTSGWHDQGTSDFISQHIYFTPIKVPHDPRCFLLSEFGGYSKASLGHMYNPLRIFGYRVYPTKKALSTSYKKLYETRIIPNIEKGLSATVYTQLSDVEEEINGLVTYDRKVEKLDRAFVKEINDRCKI